MNRDFNNATDLTNIYNAINSTNLAVSLLPTKLDVSTSINNYNTQLLTTSKTYSSIQSFNEIICNKLSLITPYFLAYTSIPILQPNQIGSVLKNEALSNVTFSNYDIYINANSISIPVGIYLITYTFLVATSSNVTEKGWIQHGISTNNLSNNIAKKTNYFLTTNFDPFSISETYYYVANTSIVINNNCSILSYESTGLSTRFFVSQQTVSAMRIA